MPEREPDARVERAWPRVALFGYSMATDHPFENRMAASERSADLSFTIGDPPWPAPSTDETAVYASPHRFPSGQALISVHRLSEGTLCRWGEVVDFHIEPASIVAHVLDAQYQFMVELRLLGPVLAHLLEDTGRLALHGSAVVTDGRAVGFLSENHGGKTSMAATLLQRGAALLTDDLLGLEVGNGEVTALAGYPQMRMWPREAQHFWGSVEDLKLVHPGLDKRRVPVGQGGLGDFRTEPARLDAIYILERLGNIGEFNADMQTVSGARALMQLSEHCFLNYGAEELGWLSQRMELLSGLLASVQVRRARFTAGPADILRLCELIEKDLAAL